MGSRFIGVNKQRVHLWRRPGDGPALLFFHATGFHARIWDRIASRFPDRLIYQVDMPGHGLSERPGETFQWDRAGETMAALVEALELEAVTGVGHSMGGQLLLSAAARQPQRFRNLLLLDPVVLPPSVIRFMQQMDTGAIARRRNDWESIEAFHQAYRDRPPFRSWNPDVFRDYADHALVPKEEGGGYRLACAPDFEASVYRNFGAEELHERLADIRVPVHIIRAKGPEAGDKPLDFQRSPTWPELVNRLPNATEDYRPELGHFFPMEDPELIIKMVTPA